MFKEALAASLTSLSTIYLSSCNGAFENILNQNTDSKDNQNQVVLFNSYDQGCRKAISKLSQQLYPLDTTQNKINNKEVCLSDIQLKLKEYRLYDNKNKSKIFKLEEDLYKIQSEKSHISKSEYLKAIEKYRSQLAPENYSKLVSIGKEFNKIHKPPKKNHTETISAIDFNKLEFDELEGYAVNINDFNLLLESARLDLSKSKQKIFKEAVKNIYTNNEIISEHKTLPIAKVLNELNLNLLVINKDLKKNNSIPIPENPWNKFNESNENYLSFRDLENLNQNLMPSGSITTLIPMTELELIQIEGDNSNSLTKPAILPESVFIDGKKHHDKLTLFVANSNGVPFEKSMSITVNSMLPDTSINTQLEESRDKYYKQNKSYYETIHFIQKHKNKNKLAPLIISSSSDTMHVNIFKDDKEALGITVEEMVNLKNSNHKLDEKKEKVADKLYWNAPGQFYRTKEIGFQTIDGDNEFVNLGGKYLSLLGNSGDMKFHCIVNSSIPSNPLTNISQGSYQCVGAKNQKDQVSDHIQDTQKLADQFNYELLLGVPANLYKEFKESGHNKNIAAIVPLTASENSPLGKDPQKLEIGTEKDLLYLKDNLDASSNKIFKLKDFHKVFPNQEKLQIDLEEDPNKVYISFHYIDKNRFGLPERKIATYYELEINNKKILVMKMNGTSFATPHQAAETHQGLHK